MSVETSGKVFRLVRLRRFQEQRASADLRTGLVEAMRTEAALLDAERKVKDMESWKARPDSLGALDLGAYQAVLAYEYEAMTEQDECEKNHEQSLIRRDEATRHYVNAASATKVAEQRRDRRVSEARDKGEKNDFDQLSDLLLGVREKEHG